MKSADNLFDKHRLGLIDYIGTERVNDFETVGF